MPNLQPAAVLWDMDGTLIDSEHYWMNSEQQLAKSTGAIWTAEDGMNLIGMSLYDSTRVMKQKLGLSEEPEQIIENLTDSVISQLGTPMPWRPGAIELLLELKSRGIKCALVTMSMRRMALAVADKAGDSVFDVVVAGDDVIHGKPHPEAYLKAAELLGVDIRDCIAFEDSVTGLRSAEASEAIAVGIPNIVQLEQKPGRHIWQTLEGVTVDHLIDFYKEQRANDDRK
jgi:HAD superfamily hydrolase (TIGR01509 family)